MQHNAADQLHAERLHAQHAPCGLAHGGKGLGQDVIRGLAVCKALFEFAGLGLELGIAEL